jgi:hypothetical protein
MHGTLEQTPKCLRPGPLLKKMRISWYGAFLCLALLALFCQLNAAAQEAPKIIRSNSDPAAAAAARVAAQAYWTVERIQAATPMDLLAADSSNLPAVVYRPTDPGSSGFSPGQVSIAALANRAGVTPGQPPSAVLGTKSLSGLLGPFPAPEATPAPLSFQQNYPYPEPFSRADVPRYSYDESTLAYPSYPQSTVGKLFFTINGSGFVCSASVIRPHLLVTARHCVYDKVNNFGNWVFYPAWHNGPNATLGGGWIWRNWVTWDCATGPCPPDAFDIAFIQTYDDDQTGCNGSNGGLPIEFYTGFLGYAYYGNTGNEAVNHYTATGYPQAAPFSGAWMVRSDASTADFELFGVPDTLEIGSDQTGGTSGGPWILAWDEGSNPASYFLGDYVNGLNSFKWTNPARPLEIAGPQFKDYNFNQLRLIAEGMPCP